MRFRLAVVLILLTGFGWLAADEVRTLTGKSATGTLTSISEQSVAVETKDGPVTVPLAQVLAIDIAPVKGVPAGVKSIGVRLIDDTVLHCQDAKFEGGNATLTLLSGVTIKLPLASMTWMLRGEDDAKMKKKFDELANQKIRRDRIVILREGELNPLEGTLGEADAQGKTIQFKRDGADPLPIQLERLHALIFYRPEGPAEAPICRVHDTDGNIIAAAKIGFKDKQWRLGTTFGTAVPLPEGSVSKVDFNMGKLTYLSDMDPTKVTERSGIGLVVRHKKDANLDGEPILIDRRYQKGLSMHAHTELEYDLGGKFKELKGTLGIDIRTGADSQPTVSIYCDGEKRFSETITAKAPRPINLNVKDVGTLKIVVGSRNELDLHDHVTFGDARVSQ
jgi:hypothetical protein